MKNSFKKLKNYFVIGLQVFLIFAFIIHVSIKDFYYVSAFIFYAVPLPLMVLGWLFLSFIGKASARKFFIINIIILTVFWVKQSYVFSTETTDIAGMEVVLWNAYRKHSFEEIVRNRQTKPDVIVLTESDKDKYHETQKAFPEYYYYFNHHAVAIASKAPLKIHSSKTIDHVTIVHFTTQDIDFYAVDLYAALKFSRKDMLENIASRIKTTEKTIILGDFNTPLESRFFKDFKANYQHAFMAKGSGFRETWCWNLPILSLDHIWVSNDITILKTEKKQTWKSDHAILTMYLEDGISK